MATNGKPRTVMRPRSWLGALAVAAATLAGPGVAQAAEPLPIFDAHVHYSRDAWPILSPAAALARLDAAGVRWALVSSSPDDGTLRLYRHAPQRIVPELRPYRDTVDAGNWTHDAGFAAYMAGRLDGAPYRGIGEFHLFDAADAAGPAVRAAVARARADRLLLHVHSGAAPVRALFAQAPDVRVLWAHAGMVEPPSVIGELLDRHPTLWVELSFRAGDIGRGDGLDPAWRALLLRHTERFVVGTDTYVNGRWSTYGLLVAAHRSWLERLPRAAAEQIAYANALRLFGLEE